MRRICRNCIYYERILGVRQGYCRSPQSYYYDCKRQGGDKGADRCYIPYTEKLKPKKEKKKEVSPELAKKLDKKYNFDGGVYYENDLWWKKG